jgi:hypothetical protein
MHRQIDHILIARRQHSSILDVQSFRADCDTDHNLVVAKVGDGLAVSKQAMHRVHMEWFNLKNKEVEGKRSIVLICLQLWKISDTELHINRACETIRENIKISAKENLGYYELKKHKPWFN